ncbi:hypothetical protein HGRIS_001731 [Hohenbuehelia grisea]|uniref:Uncharacterized protein n=1 Tax=Hohenbuehelia grisea TaxID=104357 RepID=A0ABR3JIY5_9AGAR
MSSSTAPEVRAPTLTVPSIIGIVVGACAVLSSVAAVVVVLHRRRRSRARKAQLAAEFRSSNAAEASQGLLQPDGTHFIARSFHVIPQSDHLKGEDLLERVARAETRLLLSVEKNQPALDLPRPDSRNSYDPDASINGLRQQETASWDSHDAILPINLPREPPVAKDIVNSAEPWTSLHDHPRPDSRLSGFSDVLAALPPLSILTHAYPSPPISAALASSIYHYSPESAYSTASTPVFQFDTSRDEFVAPSDAPPVPALPRPERQSSLKRPLEIDDSQSSPDEASLHRMDTVVIAKLLKARAKRASPPADGLARTFTQVSRIERDGSIKSLRTPIQKRAPRLPISRSASKQRSTPNLRAGRQAAPAAATSPRRMRSQASLTPVRAMETLTEDPVPSLSISPSSTMSPGLAPVTPPSQPRHAPSSYGHMKASKSDSSPPLPPSLSSTFPSSILKLPAPPRTPSELTGAFRTSIMLPSPISASAGFYEHHPPPLGSWFATTAPLNVRPKSSNSSLRSDSSSNPSHSRNASLSGQADDASLDGLGAGVMTSERFGASVGMGQRVESMHGVVGRKDNAPGWDSPGSYTFTVENYGH